MACLTSLFRAKKSFSEKLEMTVILTDDGSTDGTAVEVLEKYPEVTVLQGNGNLYWAGGMRNSWRHALNQEFDGYLLLNDDTILETNVFDDLQQTQAFSLSEYGMPGIYIASTLDPVTNQFSYGGAVLTHKFLLRYKLLPPDGTFQKCDLGNANIMYVSNEARVKLGILFEGYKHMAADYDYTLNATRNQIPVLITPHYCGTCVDDHSDTYKKFIKLSIKKRIGFLYSPKGLALSDNILFMRRNFPLRLPFVFISGWVKIFFPELYVAVRKNLRMDDTM